MMFIPGHSHSESNTNVPDDLQSVLNINNLAIEKILNRQHKTGYWVYELEADTTIPAEYVFLQHVMESRNPEQEKKISTYILSRQLADGSWPLYAQGPGNISATVKGPTLFLN